MAFRFDKLTIKAQEAVQRAQSLAADRGNPQIEPLHSARRAAGRERRASSARFSTRSGPTAQQLEQIVQAELGHLPKMSRRRRAARGARRCTRCSKRPNSKPTHDEGRVRLDRALAAGADRSRHQGQKRPQAQRHRRSAAAQGAASGPRQRTRDRSKPRGKIQRAARNTASTWSNGPARASSTR